ncbi:MAG: hypothetical protein LBH75_01490 [Treponema sp.]|nr:hypothetical protein [Treponema sp.]
MSGNPSDNTPREVVQWAKPAQAGAYHARGRAPIRYAGRCLLGVVSDTMPVIKTGTAATL